MNVKNTDINFYNLFTTKPHNGAKNYQVTISTCTCQTSCHEHGEKRKRSDEINFDSEGYYSSEEDNGRRLSTAPQHPITELKRISFNGLDFFSDRNGYVHGYCDGAFKRKTAAIGIWFSPDHPK